MSQRTVMFFIMVNFSWLQSLKNFRGQKYQVQKWVGGDTNRPKKSFQGSDGIRFD